MRVKKPPLERYAELLDCAQRLFFARGYDNTTVNDVIREAGVSKGAFYHYFPSKEALLEALATRLARDSMDRLQEILDDPSMDAVSRLNAFLAGSRKLKVETAPQTRNAFAAIFQPENIMLYHRIDEAVTAVASPVLSRLLEQGVDEGVFDTPDPEVTAEMLLQMRSSMRLIMADAMGKAEAGEVDEAAEMLDRRLRLYGLAFDRVLGLPDGTIRVTEPGFARAVLSGGE